MAFRPPGKRLLIAVKLVGEASLLDTLPHVLARIDSYLFPDGNDLTLEAASTFGYVPLLDRVGKLEWSGLSQSFRFRRFHSAVQSVICKGSVEVLEWWLTVYMPKQATRLVPLMLENACLYNRLDVLQFLYQRGFFNLLRSRVDIRCKTPEVANWIHERLRHVTSPSYEVEFKAEGGFTMLQLAYARGIQFYSDIIYDSIADKAAAAGHLEALQWILARELEFGQCTRDALSLAVSSERFDVVQWLYNQYPRGYFRELIRGCTNFDTIQWLFDHYEWSTLDDRRAWIFVCLNRTRYLATLNPDMMKCLIMACPEADNGTAMEMASKHGDLELVQCLHALGAKSTPAAMDYAASRGHLNVLQWLRDNRAEGCTNEAVEWAAEKGHLDVIQWLHLHESECFTPRAMDNAVLSGRIEIMKWFNANRTEGCTTKAMDWAVARGNIQIVRWLYEHRPEVHSKSEIVAAARTGKFHVVKYLYEMHSSSVNAQLALVGALLWGHLKVVKFLFPLCNFNVGRTEIRECNCKWQFGVAEYLLRASVER